MWGFFMSLEMFTISECSCERCQRMCHTPCTGTPEDIEAIMEAGYGDRLCLDDWPGEVPDIHPALKGYESQNAPYHTQSKIGCTFWKEGKCELHDKGLKPLGGKYAHHDLPEEECDKITPYSQKIWNTEKGKSVVSEWKKRFLKDRQRKYEE